MSTSGYQDEHTRFAEDGSPIPESEGTLAHDGLPDLLDCDDILLPGEEKPEPEGDADFDFSPGQDDAPVPVVPAKPVDPWAYTGHAGDPDWGQQLVDEFNRKDLNSDGVLSIKEIKIKDLLRLDVDKNGRISFEEYRDAFITETMRDFRKLDVDHDEMLNFAEFSPRDPGPKARAKYCAFATQPRVGMTLDEYRNYRIAHG